MNSRSVSPNHRPRFTIQTILLITLLFALVLGWRSSNKQSQTQIARQTIRLRYAEQELNRARSKLRDGQGERRTGNRPNWLAELDGAELPNVTISSVSKAFQGASFKHCDLENATLEGGVSSFQQASFDNSILKNATLAGGEASFQAATFVDADLTDAILKGAGSSFQNASFENAILVRAKLVGSFQSVNISGSRFEGADLSKLEALSLESCYFKHPPTYDRRTRFPVGFDPVTQQWHLVSE